MYRFLFNYVKKKLPRISDTELIALRCGNTSLDREILTGSVSHISQVKYTPKIDDKNINHLLNTYDKSNIFPNDNYNKWIN